MLHVPGPKLLDSSYDNETESSSTAADAAPCPLYAPVSAGLSSELIAGPPHLVIVDASVAAAAAAAGAAGWPRPLSPTLSPTCPGLQRDLHQHHQYEANRVDYLLHHHHTQQPSPPQKLLSRSLSHSTDDNNHNNNLHIHHHIADLDTLLARRQRPTSAYPPIDLDPPSMSLAQHVTSIEGIDRESPRLGPQQHVGGSIAGSFRVRPTASINFANLNDRESLLSSPRLRPRDSIYGTLNSTNGTVKGVRRVISYDAFVDPKKDVGEALVAAVPAYEVSTSRRLMQVVVTILACWLASGIVFGFAALKPILVHQQVYREYCTAEEVGAGVHVCRDQDLRLNAFFAVASTTCNIAALPAGTLLDKYGARVTIAIGSVMLAIGSFVMASAFSVPEFDGYMIGNVLLALGGSFIFVPSFAIANAFPKHSGTIVALVTGAFDASAAVFLFYRLAYEATEGAFSPQKFFYGYIIVPVLIFIAQFTLMNGDEYTSVPQIEEKMELVRDATKDVHDSDDERSDAEIRRIRADRREQREDALAELESLLGGPEEREVRDALEDKRHEASGVWGALHGQTAWQQMQTPWFILITLLTVLQMLRMNFFIATIKAQYEYMLSSPRLAKQINTFFDVALPVGGVLATPFIGLLLDHVSTAGMLAVLVTLITCVGVLGSLPFLWAAYANVIFFVLLRPLYYSAMSDYATKVFGFATFGKVYGLIICFSGVVNLFQPLIDAANHDVFHDDPAPINIVMAVLGGLFGIVLVIFVWLQGRRAASEAKKAEMAFNGEYIIRETDEESLYL